MSNITEALEFMKNENVSLSDAITSVQNLCYDIIAVYCNKWRYSCPRKKEDKFGYFAFYFDDNGKFHCCSNANIDVIELCSYDIASIARKVSKLRYKERKCGKAEVEALNLFFGRELFKLNPELRDSAYGWYSDSIVCNTSLFANNSDTSIAYYAGSKERDIVVP